MIRAPSEFLPLYRKLRCKLYKDWVDSPIEALTGPPSFINRMLCGAGRQNRVRNQDFELKVRAEFNPLWHVIQLKLGRIAIFPTGGMLALPP